MVIRNMLNSRNNMIAPGLLRILIVPVVLKKQAKGQLPIQTP